MSEFYEGEYIIYRNGEKYELGRITSLREDGAFVCYHEGETAAKTPYDHMHKLINAYTIKSTSIGGNRFDDVEEGKMTNQQAINILNGLEQSLDDYCELNDEGKAAFRMAIMALESFGNSEQLPSAQPERPRGEWINRSLNILYPDWERYTCSACGKHAYNYDFCPNCGADMRGETK